MKIKKHLHVLLIAAGTVMMAVAMAILAINLTNVYSAVDQLAADSSAINKIGGAEFTMHAAIALLVVGVIVFILGIILLTRRLVRH